MAHGTSELGSIAPRAKKTPPERGFRKSPLPDSNRRPLPYHGSPAKTRRTPRKQKDLQRPRNGQPAVVGSNAQRSAPALPTECPGTDKQAHRRQAHRRSRLAQPHRLPAAGAPDDMER